MIKGIGKFLAAGVLLLAASGVNAAYVHPSFINLELASTSNFVEMGQTYDWLGDQEGTVDGETFTELFFIDSNLANDVRITVTVEPGIGASSQKGYGDMSWSLEGGDSSVLTWADGSLNPDAVFTLSYILPAFDFSDFEVTGTRLGVLDDYTVIVEVSAVPVPGAAILFGSAVMAFGFISRRRKSMSA